MAASYNLLLALFPIASSAVLSRIEISARGKYRALSMLTVSRACQNVRLIFPKCLFDVLVPLSFPAWLFKVVLMAKFTKVLRGPLLIELKNLFQKIPLRFRPEIHPSAPFLLIQARVSSCSHSPVLGSQRQNWTLHFEI